MPEKVERWPICIACGGVWCGHTDEERLAYWKDFWARRNAEVLDKVEKS